MDEKIRRQYSLRTVNDIREALENPFVQNNNKIVPVKYKDETDSVENTAYFLSPPFSFSGVNQIDYTTPHKMREDTDDIMKALGYSGDEIADARKSGVII